MNRVFVDNTCLPRGQDQYRLRARGQGFAFNDEAEDDRLRALPELLKDYTPEKVERLTGVPAARHPLSRHALRRSEAEGDEHLVHGRQPAHPRHVDEQPHQRHPPALRQNRHARQQPVLAHRPAVRLRHRARSRHAATACPHGVVTNEKDRKLAAEIWGVPPSASRTSPAYHTVEMFRALDRGDVRLLDPDHEPVVTMPKLHALPRRREEGRAVHRRLDIYPTPTTDVADVDSAVGDVDRARGHFRQHGAADAALEQMLKPPGEAKKDGWQIIEVRAAWASRSCSPGARRHAQARVLEEYRRLHARPRQGWRPTKSCSPPGVIWPFVKGKETK